MKSNWQVITSGVPQGPYKGQYCLTFLLMGWTMGQKVLPASFQMIPNCEGMLDILENRAAIQRDLSRKYKWAEKRFMKSGKWKILTLGLNNHMQKQRLAADWLESSFAEKDLSFQVDKEQVIQQCALATKKTNYILNCISKSTVSRQQVVIVFSFGTYETASVMLFWAPQRKTDIDMSISVLGDIQKLFGHGPGQLFLGGPG